MKLSTRLDPGWVLVVLLGVFALAPLTYPGFFEVQSGFLSPLNVEHVAEAPDWGRAADLVRGEGKLPYLLIYPFFMLSGSGTAAVRWGYGLTFVLGALGTYAWTRRWLGSKGAVLASVVYTYLPWHLSTVYARGAYAEAWLWASWPFMLWALDLWSEGRFPTATIVGLPAVIAAFWTQPGLCALAILLLVAYGAAVDAKRPWPLLWLVAALALPLLLLWFAARIVPEPQDAFAEGYLYPFQLLSAAWEGTTSFQLGLAGVGLSIVALALWFGQRREASEGVAGADERGENPQNAVSLSARLDRAFWFWVGVLAVLVMLTLSLSSFLWRFTGFETFLNYPWQLLALIGLPLAFLAGSTVRLDSRLGTLPAWAGLVALVILASYPYLSPRFTQVDPGPEPVAMFQPVEAAAPQIMVLDYEILPATEITPTLTLTLTWQAVAPVADDYTVFVHVLAEGGSVQDGVAAQRDTRPCDGECPTNTWVPGEIIVDRYQLDLASDAPPGRYRLAMGLYLLNSGERVIVVGRDDRTVFFDVP